MPNLIYTWHALIATILYPLDSIGKSPRNVGVASCKPCPIPGKNIEPPLPASVFSLHYRRRNPPVAGVLRPPRLELIGTICHHDPAEIRYQNEFQVIARRLDSIEATKQFPESLRSARNDMGYSIWCYQEAIYWTWYLRVDWFSGQPSCLAANRRPPLATSLRRGYYVGHILPPANPSWDLRGPPYQPMRG